MKFVYVMVSNNNDTYFFQMVLSIKSLLEHTKKPFILLVTDVVTYNYLENNKKRFLENLIDNILIVDLDENRDVVYKSRFLKTNLFEIVDDDFLFLDCDTIINYDLQDIYTYPLNLGFVLNAHQPNFQERLLSDIKRRNYIYFVDKTLGFSISKIMKYYNSGVIFCRKIKCNELFFNKWHLLWLKTQSEGFYEDQISLNQANFEMQNIIEELDGSWNCQLLRNGCSEYYKNAKILHYYGSDILGMSTNELKMVLPNLIDVYSRINDCIKKEE